MELRSRRCAAPKEEIPVKQRYWNATQHQLFLVALELLPKQINPIEIALFINQQLEDKNLHVTNTQVSTHLQKYRKKMGLRPKTLPKPIPNRRRRKKKQSPFACPETVDWSESEVQPQSFDYTEPFEGYDGPLENIWSYEIEALIGTNKLF